MPDITVHMVVKNEDQWVWFALQSILPHASKILITDTGSIDHTIQLIQSISSPKIEFSREKTSSPQQITDIRQRQVNLTETDWFWLVDGDEIYPDQVAREVVKATTGKYEGIAVRRYDLMGDIYHRQKETVGVYNLFGQKGHLVSRLFHKKRIPGIYVDGVYPMEGYYDAKGVITSEHDPSKWYITKGYLYHAMYLRRSSQGSNLAYVFNRSKYKIETGIKVATPYPEAFDLKRPNLVPDPRRLRSKVYELTARIVTPIKNLKRAAI